MTTLPLPLLCQTCMLLKARVNPDQQMNDGWTALMISSENGDSEVVNLLLKHGCNLDHQANDGSTTHDSKS